MDHDNVADVVFIVEGTAVNGAYINDLKSNYLIPTLEYFSQGLLDDREYLVSDRSATLYGIVLYKTAQAMPNNCCVTYGPFSSPQKVLNVIDKLELTGGKSESNANLAEGLATALVCFDDLNERRFGDVNVQRHCILICNSSPYTMPVSECYQYDNKSVEQLASIFHEKKINFSIISPRKIPILFKLFIKADGDLPLTTKNFCKDKRHLVLLKGFNLKERPISPSSHQAVQNAPSPLTTANNVMENQNNAIMSQNQTIQNQQQHTQHINPQFQNNPQNPMANNFNPNVQQANRQWLYQQQQQQRPFMSGPGPNQPNPLQCQNPNSALISQLSTPPNQQGNQILTANQQQQQQALRMQMINQQQQQAQQQQQQQQVQQQQQQQQPQMCQMQPQNSNIAPNQHIMPQQQQQPQRSVVPEDTVREKIWSGVLEWAEKGKGDQQKMTRQIPCTVHSNVKDGEVEVKADNWPQRLFMQLMPKHIIANIGGQFLKESKMLIFRLGPCEALESLSKALIAGTAGCVHINAATSSPHDIKILLLLYTQERKSFLGFIPNNQTVFVDKLRKVIQQKQLVRCNQQGQAANVQQQNPHAGNMQNTHQPNNQVNVNVNVQQPKPPPGPMEANMQMQEQHFNSYPQMQMQMQDNMANTVQQQNEYKMNMIQQQQRALGNMVPQQNMQQGAPVPPQRMVRPIMSNNPGLRHLLQQQQAATPNQFRPSMPAMQAANMGGPHVPTRPNTFDDSNFDFM